MRVRVSNSNQGTGTKTRHSRLFTKLLFAVLFCGGLCHALDGQEIRLDTNLGLMGGVVEALVRENLNFFESDSAKCVMIAIPSDETGLASFVQSHIVHAFSEEGRNVYVRTDSLLRGVKIVWHPLDVSMEYPERIRQGIFHGSRIARRASCNLFFEAVQIPEGKVLWAGSLSKEKQDTVSASILDDLEQGGLILGRPARPGESGIFRLFEPLAMLGTIALLGYLFYVIRS